MLVLREKTNHVSIWIFIINVMKVVRLSTHLKVVFCMEHWIPPTSCSFQLTQRWCAPTHQGFPQLLRTWGWGLKSVHGGEHRGLKMLSQNTCEGVHLIVKLLAISLQACKFTKNGLLHTYVSRILLCFF